MGYPQKSRQNYHFRLFLPKNLPINSCFRGCFSQITKNFLKAFQDKAFKRYVALGCSFATFTPNRHWTEICVFSGKIVWKPLSCLVLVIWASRIKKSCSVTRNQAFWGHLTGKNMNLGSMPTTLTTSPTYARTLLIVMSLVWRFRVQQQIVHTTEMRS